VDAHDEVAARPRVPSNQGEDGGRSVLFVVRGPITIDDIPGLCTRVRALFDGGDVGRVICDVTDLTAPDGVTIDALARLQLASRRHGSLLVLRGACIDLLGLLAAAGLSDIVPLDDSL
jgi:hypothetical protein